MSPAVQSSIYSDKLADKFVFLSASFPNQGRSAADFETANPFEITDATIAAAQAVFGASGKLVFGGHPTISPLILSVARDFLQDFPSQYRPFVYIFQTRYFPEILHLETPMETRQLEEEGIGKIVWTETVDEDLNLSLLTMRTEMLQSTDSVGGIFIGGMEGVYAAAKHPESPPSEFDLFREKRPGRPIYPIGAPGGASQALLRRLLDKQEEMSWSFRSFGLEELAQPLPYTVLMNKIVSDIIEQL